MTFTPIQIVRSLARLSTSDEHAPSSPDDATVTLDTLIMLARDALAPSRPPGPTRLAPEDVFYMVLSDAPATPAPKRRHDTHPAALRVAIHLALTHGRPFYVLKAKNLATPETAAQETTDAS